MIDREFPSGVKPAIGGRLILRDNTVINLSCPDLAQGSVTIRTGTSRPNEFSVGSCVIGTLDFTLMNKDRKFDSVDWTNAKVRLSFTAGGHTVQSDDYFIVSHKEAGGIIYVQAEDAFRVLDERYLYELDDRIKWPADAVDVINAIVSLVWDNVSVAGLTAADRGVTVSRPDKDEMTLRSVMEYLAQCLCKHATYKYPVTIAFGWYDLSDKNAFDAGNTFTHDIDIQGAGIDGLRVKTASGSTTYAAGQNEGRVLEIDGNPFIDPSNIATVASRIWAGVHGIGGFFPGSFSIAANPAIEPGDTVIINTGTAGAGTLKTIITNLTYRPGQLQEPCTADFFPGGSDLRVNRSAKQEATPDAGEGVTPEQAKDIARDTFESDLDNPDSEIRKRLDSLYKSGGGGGGGGGGDIGDDTDWDKYDLPWYEDWSGKQGEAAMAVYNYLRPASWMVMPPVSRFEMYILLDMPTARPVPFYIDVRQCTIEVEFGASYGGNFVAFEHHVQTELGSRDCPIYSVDPAAIGYVTAEGHYQVMIRLFKPYADYNDNTGSGSGFGVYYGMSAQHAVEISEDMFGFGMGSLNKLMFLRTIEDTSSYGLPGNVLVAFTHGSTISSGGEHLVALSASGWEENVSQSRPSPWAITVNPTGSPRLLTIELGTYATLNERYRFQNNYLLRYCGDINTSATDIQNMFSDCHALTRVGNINAPNATAVGGMFSNCYNLRKIAGINVPKATGLTFPSDTQFSLEEVGDVYAASLTSNYIAFPDTIKKVGHVDVNKAVSFQNCTRLRHVDGLTLGTSVANMFSGCTNLKDVGFVDLPSGATCQTMFYNCKSLESVPAMDWTMIRTATEMFRGSGLTSIGDIDMPACTTAEGMFRDSAIRTVGNINLPAATTLNYMFSGSSLQKVGDITAPAATSLAYMFQNAADLTDVGRIETGNNANASYMFYGCIRLKDMPVMTYERLLNVQYMFREASIAETGDLSLDACTTATSMFYRCRNLRKVGNISIGKNVTAAITANSMFIECNRLEEAGEISFDGKPTSATAYHNAQTMFQYCTLLRSAGAVKSAAPLMAASLFAFCYRLEQSGGIDCDTDGLTSNIANYSLASAYSRCENLSAVGNIHAPGCATTVSMFENCYSLNTIGTVTPGKTCTGMFRDCHSLIGTPDMELQAGTSAGEMFANCWKLKKNPITNMGDGAWNGIFNKCFELEDAGTLTDAGYGTSSANVTPFSVNPGLWKCELVPTSNIRGWTLEGMLTTAQLAKFLQDLPAGASSRPINLSGCIASRDLTEDQIAAARSKGYNVTVASFVYT